MSILFHPLSLFGKAVVGNFPTYFQSVPSILMLFYILFMVGKKGKKFDVQIKGGAVFFIMLAFICQAVASLRTILTFPITGVGIFEKYVQFLLLMIYFILTYLFMKNALDSEQKIVNFFKGIYLTSVLLFGVIFMQLCFIQFHWFEQGLIWINRYLSEGSYSSANNTTLIKSGIDYLLAFHRPNGLDPESRDVAIRLVLMCTPFMLAALRFQLPLKSSDRLGRVIHSLSILTTIFILFSLRTSTGYVLGTLTLLLFLFYTFIDVEEHHHLLRKITIFLVVIASLVLVEMYFGLLQDINKVFFFRAGSGNRKNSMLALWRTFLQHPLLGTGFDFSSPWNILNAPFEYANNHVNLSFYLAKGELPALSVFFSWLAQFGLLIVLPMIAYFVKLKLDFTLLIERLNATNATQWQKRFFAAMNEAYFLFLVFFIPVSFLLFHWEGLGYLLTIIYFIVTKKYLSNLLDKIAPISEKGDVFE